MKKLQTSGVDLLILEQVKHELNHPLPYDEDSFEGWLLPDPPRCFQPSDWPPTKSDDQQQNQIDHLQNQIDQQRNQTHHLQNQIKHQQSQIKHQQNHIDHQHNQIDQLQNQIF